MHSSQQEGGGSAEIPARNSSPPPVNKDALAVLDQFRARMGRQLSGVQVAQEDGAIVLSGTTSTYYAKQMAQECVRQALGGTTKVINRIVVTG